MACLRTAQDKAAETGQVTIAWDLLYLLLMHSFSVIIYLCTFFTQVPWCPKNSITFEDIGCIFGLPVFGGPMPAVHCMVVWFLKCWNHVLDGLLNGKLDNPTTTASLLSSSPLPSRQDMRLI